MQTKDSPINHADSSQARAMMMTTVRQAGSHLLQRVQQGLSKLEFVYTPHPAWPLPRSRVVAPLSPLRISVLDSSFNPPTLAHLALANSRRSQGLHIGEQKESEARPLYDAKLLLLSVKNADKTLKPGDATYQQRLEMMALLAMDVEPDTNDSTSPSTPAANTLTPTEHANVAIAIIDEPIFVGKSQALLSSLKTRFSNLNTHAQFNVAEHIELNFIVGLDTLERLFSSRYYSSEADMMASLRKFFSPGPEGDNSRIVSARRITEPSTSPRSNQDTSPLSLAKEFIDSGRVETIDLGDKVSTYSSTTVRRSRNSVGSGQDSLWRKLVTKDVAEYIVEHRLYQVEI